MPHWTVTKERQQVNEKNGPYKTTSVTEPTAKGVFKVILECQLEDQLLL